MAEKFWVYVNGDYLPGGAKHVSVFDHGVLYGDGVFEGIRAYNGRIFKLKEHVERLYDSATGIHLKVPISKKEMERAIIETCLKNKLRDAYIRPIVTRGDGDLNLSPVSCKKPNIMIVTRPLAGTFADKLKKGLRLVTAPVARNPPQCLSPNIKSLNYLNNILARIFAQNHGADEALMLDIHGYVSEASGDNIFFVKRGILGTPPTATNLKGITRATVLDLAQGLGIDTRVSPCTLFDIYNADEVFVTGTAAEIGPVVEIDGQKIGDGKPGKITISLMKRFRKLLTTTGTPIR